MGERLFFNTIPTILFTFKVVLRLITALLRMGQGLITKLLRQLNPYYDGNRFRAFQVPCYFLRKRRHICTFCLMKEEALVMKLLSDYVFSQNSALKLNN
jgi:hypothetical protein